jgi:hypothetical protein
VAHVIRRWRDARRARALAEVDVLRRENADLQAQVYDATLAVEEAAVATRRAQSAIAQYRASADALRTTISLPEGTLRAQRLAVLDLLADAGPVVDTAAVARALGSTWYSPIVKVSGGAGNLEQVDRAIGRALLNSARVSQR